MKLNHAKFEQTELNSGGLWAFHVEGGQMEKNYWFLTVLGKRESCGGCSMQSNLFTAIMENPFSHLWQIVDPVVTLNDSCFFLAQNRLQSHFETACLSFPDLSTLGVFKHLNTMHCLYDCGILAD